MPAGWKTRRSWPPQISQRSNGGSEKLWTVSKWLPQEAQTYSYVGTTLLSGRDGRMVRRQYAHQYDREPVSAVPTPARPGKCPVGRWRGTMGQSDGGSNGH